VKLSERIEQADYDCRGLWSYLESAKHPADGDAANRLKAIMQTLLDCERLAKRYEDAPSGEVWQHAYVAGQRSSTIVITREPEDGIAIMGQRVRILLDTEG
jgi:hypothetical protein